MNLVSVVMPMRNAETYVEAAVRSVLAQDVELELIVIDDGSTDGSANIVRSINDPRVRIIPGPQSGIADAFNTGLREARGKYLVRCDADDLYPPERLRWQLEFLESHDEFGAVCGYYETVDDQGKTIVVRNADHVAGEVTDELRRGVGRSHMCAYLFRTEALRAIGGCRSWFITAEDADLQYRLAETTRIWYEPQCAYLYRVHDASITHSRESQRRKFFDEAARRFQRQRQTDGRDDLQANRPPAVPESQGTDSQAARHIQSMLLERAWRAHAAGNKGAALSAGWRACVTRPMEWSAWRSLAALLLKPAGHTAERN